MLPHLPADAESPISPIAQRTDCDLGSLELLVPLGPLFFMSHYFSLPVSEFILGRTEVFFYRKLHQKAHLDNGSPFLDSLLVLNSQTTNHSPPCELVSPGQL